MGLEHICFCEEHGVVPINEKWHPYRLIDREETDKELERVRKEGVKLEGHNRMVDLLIKHVPTIYGRILNPYFGVHYH